VRAQDGFVAQDRGEILAFATTAPASSQAVEITWLAVQAKWRGSGLGRRLVERTAAEAVREGFALLCVLTLAPSVPEPFVKDGYEGTRRFWQRLGFVPVKELSLSDWPAQALLLIRSLGPSPESRFRREGISTSLQ
jgi:N-acetylglutamate synthase-like GNAT family acetyltransferase